MNSILSKEVLSATEVIVYLIKEGILTNKEVEEQFVNKEYCNDIKEMAKGNLKPPEVVQDGQGGGKVVYHKETVTANFDPFIETPTGS